MKRALTLPQFIIAILIASAGVLWLAYLKTHQVEAKTKAQIESGIILNAK